MKDLIWAILLLVVALGITAWYKSSQKSKGNIIDRKKDFAEYAEIFTIRKITDEEFAEAVKKADFKGTLNTTVTGDTGKLFLEQGKYYKARIAHTQQNEASSVYRFEFLSWTSKHGAPSYSIEMNKLMTKVEKMFLEIDPNAQVASVKNEIKTDRSLF